MNPTRQVPQNEADLAASGISMTSYLERYGGFRGNRETGLALWIAAHVMDAMAVQDFQGAKEYMALLTVALEQSALDGGWHLAYLLCLLEDPPNNLFADRMASDHEWETILAFGSSLMVGGGTQLSQRSRAPFRLGNKRSRTRKAPPLRSQRRLQMQSLLQNQRVVLAFPSRQRRPKDPKVRRCFGVR